jgi:Holliday junction DNA helicase RuvA
MIGLLRGKLAARQADGVVLIDVGGVGYEVFTTSSSDRTLGPSGADCVVYVHTHVKEDAIQLYGFATARERDAFRVLLGVSNIGPRTALALLSGLTVDELASAVANRDLARLGSVPGIGKKTAERLVFELQGKLVPEVLEPIPAGATGPRADLLSALVNLGYKPAQAEKALAAVGPMLAGGTAFEDALREALRVLSR